VLLQNLWLKEVNQMRQGNWSEATEMLGEANPFRETGRINGGIADVDGGIKVGCSLLFLLFVRSDGHTRRFKRQCAIYEAC
jgi:hypothetical protein